jgi:hypothetical protein
MGKECAPAAHGSNQPEIDCVHLDAAEVRVPAVALDLWVTTGAQARNATGGTTAYRGVGRLLQNVGTWPVVPRSSPHDE